MLLALGFPISESKGLVIPMDIEWDCWQFREEKILTKQENKIQSSVKSEKENLKLIVLSLCQNSSLKDVISRETLAQEV